MVARLVDMRVAQVERRVMAGGTAVGPGVAARAAGLVVERETGAVRAVEATVAAKAAVMVGVVRVVARAVVMVAAARAAVVRVAAATAAVMGVATAVEAKVVEAAVMETLATVVEAGTARGMVVGAVAEGMTLAGRMVVARTAA